MPLRLPTRMFLVEYHDRKPMSRKKSCYEEKEGSALIFWRTTLSPRKNLQEGKGVNFEKYDYELYYEIEIARSGIPGANEGVLSLLTEGDKLCRK